MTEATAEDAATDWKDRAFGVLVAAGATQVHDVPDAGLARPVARAEAEPTVRAVPPTTEEEGVAGCVGAWLGGARAVLLIRSSGVGNRVDMLGLPPGWARPGGRASRGR